MGRFESNRVGLGNAVQIMSYLRGIVPGANEKIVQIVESSGGVLYLLTELEKHRSMALEGLERACAIQPAKQRLVALLEHFVPK